MPPHDLSFRQVMAEEWTIDRRERCARRSIELWEQGVPWPDHERRAYDELLANPDWGIVPAVTEEPVAKAAPARPTSLFDRKGVVG